jgi:diaminopimelate decarboxylase
MNDLLRPALYDAWQEIIPIIANTHRKPNLFDVVGPVCETGDFLGKQRRLAIEVGDLLAVRSAGAYGFTMSSTYNSRPRVAEVVVDGAKAYLVRERETVQSLYAGESTLPG